MSQNADSYEMADEDGNVYEIQPDSYDEDGKSIYKWNDQTFMSVKVDYYPKGRIVYYGHLETGTCD
jgi:hypothetical protein